MDGHGVLRKIKIRVLLSEDPGGGWNSGGSGQRATKHHLHYGRDGPFRGGWRATAAHDDPLQWMDWRKPQPLHDEQDPPCLDRWRLHRARRDQNEHPSAQGPAGCAACNKRREGLTNQYLRGDDGLSSATAQTRGTSLQAGPRRQAFG